MAKFYAIGTYSPESFQGFIKDPEQDRKAVIQGLAKAMGSDIAGIEFLRGPYDFIATIEADRFEDVAAIKMAVEAKGAGNVIILETVEINSIARKAGTAIANYSPRCD